MFSLCRNVTLPSPLLPASTCLNYFVLLLKGVSCSQFGSTCLNYFSFNYYRVYHVHSSGRPLWRLLDGQEITHPRLVGTHLYCIVLVFAALFNSNVLCLYSTTISCFDRLHDDGLHSVLHYIALFLTT